MNNCELCNQSAQIYCQSDNASLCYDCDQNVHSANFLVAKHSRTLLCHKCQSPTPWSASGLNLCRAVTVCVNCDSSHRQTLIADQRNDVVEEIRVDEDTESSDDEEEDYEDYDDEEEEEDTENQVVPFSSVVSPRVTGGCSSREEYCSSRSDMKRGRFDDYYIDYEEDTDTVCSSESTRRTEIDGVTSLRSW